MIRLREERSSKQLKGCYDSVVGHGPGLFLRQTGEYEMAMRRCSRCVLPNTYPGITFNGDGLCSRCPPPGEFAAVVTHGEEALRSSIDQHRTGDSKYDCLVGFSGGRDSTFALHYAVRVLGLRVLAFTVDNEFMPEQTRENIQNAIRILGVDHVVDRHNLVQKNFRPLLLSWLARPSAAMVSFLCVGCRLGLARGLLQAATHYQIPLILSGLGEPESSFATKLIHAGRNHGLRSLMFGVAREMANNPRYLALRPSLPYWMFMEYAYAGSLYGYSDTPFVPTLAKAGVHHVKLFEYIPWDEQQIMSLIQSEMSWRNYAHSQSPWRSDCTINLLKNHLYYETLGFSKNDELVSNMIRLGTMSRNDGLARVERENIIPDEFLREFFKDVDIDYRAYEKALEKMREPGRRAA